MNQTAVGKKERNEEPYQATLEPCPFLVLSLRLQRLLGHSLSSTLLQPFFYYRRHSLSNSLSNAGNRESAGGDRGGKVKQQTSKMRLPAG
jgi:hypothetical protein